MKWLITFTKTLRDRLPMGQYIISHAPVAPWFSDAYASGGYLEVNKQVGSMIDWYDFCLLRIHRKRLTPSRYNIQFYNQESPDLPRNNRSLSSTLLIRLHRFRVPTCTPTATA